MENIQEMSQVEVGLAPGSLVPSYVVAVVIDAAVLVPSSWAVRDVVVELLAAIDSFIAASSSRRRARAISR